MEEEVSVVEVVMEIEVLVVESLVVKVITVGVSRAVMVMKSLRHT